MSEMPPCGGIALIAGRARALALARGRLPRQAFGTSLAASAPPGAVATSEHLRSIIILLQLTRHEHVVDVPDNDDRGRADPRPGAEVGGVLRLPCGADP